MATHRRCSDEKREEQEGGEDNRQEQQGSVSSMAQRRCGEEKRDYQGQGAVDEPPCKDAADYRFMFLAYVAFGLAILAALGELSSPAALARPVRTTVLGVAIFGAAAAQEALRVPCIAAHATPAQKVRTLLRVVGDLLMTPVYACMPEERPVLGYQRTAENLDIVSRCPSLRCFRQTPWLHNSYMGVLALTIGDAVGAFYEKSVRRETLRTPDGGLVALDWWEEGGAGSAAAEPKGVLFVGSSVTGDGAGLVNIRNVCRLFSSHGWRCVVFVKRGCGTVMPNRQPGTRDAKPWNFSGLEDSVLAIDHVASKHPGVPICGMGFSLGGAQMRQYVNSVGAASKLHAAVLVDAATDWDRTILSCDERMPLISRILNAAMVSTFQQCGRGMPAEPVDCVEAEEVLPGGLVEFMRDYMGPAFGYECSYAAARRSLQSSLRAPSSGCRVPTLELATLNDGLIHPDIVQQIGDHYKASPKVMTAITVGGTHTVRWEGWLLDNWGSRVALEFAEAVVQQHREGGGAAG